LQEHGRVTAPGGATVTLEECSVHRPGQRAAFIMDTRLCDAVYELADRADLLILESTFLDEDAALARDYGHLTVGQAAKVAAEVGAGRLVLTHFSERYRPEDEQRFADQAAAAFGGDIFVARDLDRIPVPPRRSKEPTAPKDS
jgi:ribonuclease Z